MIYINVTLHNAITSWQVLIRPVRRSNLFILSPQQPLRLSTHTPYIPNPVIQSMTPIHVQSCITPWTPSDYLYFVLKSHPRTDRLTLVMQGDVSVQPSLSLLLLGCASATQIGYRTWVTYGGANCTWSTFSLLCSWQCLWSLLTSPPIFRYDELDIESKPYHSDSDIYAIG